MEHQVDKVVELKFYRDLDGKIKVRYAWGSIHLIVHQNLSVLVGFTEMADEKILQHPIVHL